MRRPVLERLMPESSGFNRGRIAFAATVLLVSLGAITYLLTRSSDEPVLKPEAQVTPSASRPPRELLEDPPAASPPPVLRPDFGGLVVPEPVAPAMSKPGVSPRVIKAFGPITYSPRPSQAAAAAVSQRPRPGALPPELTAIFKDLDEQSDAISSLLEKGSGSSASLGHLGNLLADGLPQRESSAQPPATRHVRLDHEPPAGPYVLRQGTVIPAQLLSEINSDLPGQVLAHVQSDVLDSLDFTTVLVPRGTKLIGVYRSGLGVGQNRLAVAWIRFLFPDGRSFDVGELPGVDSAGRSGLRDRVNHHTARIFGNALLLSLLSAGFEAAQPASDELRLSAGDLAVGGASRELERAASEILRRSGSIPPTVRIRAGTAFNVFLTGDLTFSRPY